jgi:4a-hydroxytetrahydrobiopterin dehydratase
MTAPTVLTEAEIREGLALLPHWKLNARGEIEREHELPDFAHAVLLVNAVAHVAERADHHPELHISYRQVRFALSTHSAGGLTPKDFSLAAQIERLLVAS